MPSKRFQTVMDLENGTSKPPRAALIDELVKDPMVQVFAPRELLERAGRATEGPYWHGEFDAAALDAARERLGIKLPVRIEEGYGLQLNLDGITWGQWEFNPYTVDREHVIRIQPGINVTVAEEVLAHELTHAVQLERDGYGAVMASNMENYGPDGRPRMGYEDSPAEVEAHKLSDELGTSLNVLRAS